MPTEYGRIENSEYDKTVELGRELFAESANELTITIGVNYSCIGKTLRLNYRPWHPGVCPGTNLKPYAAANTHWLKTEARDIDVGVLHGLLRAADDECVDIDVYLDLDETLRTDISDSATFETVVISYRGGYRLLQLTEVAFAVN